MRPFHLGSRMHDFEEGGTLTVWFWRRAVKITFYKRVK